MTPIEEIKQRLSIVDVVGQYVTLKKSGRNYKGLCPFHGEKTPSFMVSEELGIFKCFGCNKAGDIFKFIQEIEGLEFPQALKILADKAGVQLESEFEDKFAKKKKILYEINHLSAEFYHYFLLKHNAGKAGYSYFVDKRHLAISNIQEFKLGFAPNSWDLLFQYLSKKKYSLEDMLDSGAVVKKSSGEGYIDKFRNRVIFPLVETDNKIVGFAARTLGDDQPKYLNTNETLVFHKSQFIYGLDKAKLSLKNGSAVFVEGYMDVISAHQAGFKNFIASSGTSITQGQLKIVSRYTKDLIFCFDTDAAGVTATYRAVELAEKEDMNVKIATLPTKYKDIDELIMNDRKSAEEVLKNSVPVYDYYLSTTLKKHDKNGAIGKKKIVEELTPLLSRIKNKVTLNHYIKLLSEELGIDQEVISDIIFGKTAVSASGEGSVFGEDRLLNTYRKTPEAYTLALLFKAPLDNIETFMYVDGQNTLNEKYFSNDTYKELYRRFSDVLSGEKGDFDIKYFSSSLPIELQKSAEELYLWDLDYVANDDKLLKRELEISFQRLKDLYIKKKRLEISQKIKQAELEKNEKLIHELIKVFNELS
ncbi:DNA primase [candidate division WWE3 bacterium RIFCSPHIGHO2_12_FULL_38_15]|uniref:DNA primase n=1 Tax=candidate division WWE3 bacterium RIFCSPHIGHO2_02_FULL_38_14 TaxID=1802620 RepID=A0A1F4V8W8_UNCKA|nr:MAG: DNA primase [candidate division WWE3 bacterium RIFCSPHIGHO2_01_FULL_38_45]OGC48367.1 MAG: DNA primase [candidate division WWE3 bacterium RIFCSPHIGHO2_12_FULL_38_15]OGC53655.1 MAG: DNA primase [candidate division WWE3 bacterium RIFCSPHIGHO2_02_FULL_38_14]OGC54302.1 MAG: DNA primase [candidate division WWE3 bacterium RIFCSPLOWO2_01_FULL_37_24]HLB51546.1 DNA primase [Patescibacteria group bacterium]